MAQLCIYAKFRVKLLPGARGLLRYLKEIGIFYALAANGQPVEGGPAVQPLELAAEVPIITKG